MDVFGMIDVILLALLSNTMDIDPLNNDWLTSLSKK